MTMSEATAYVSATAPRVTSADNHVLPPKKNRTKRNMQRSPATRENSEAGIVYKTASQRQELHAAFGLVYRAYVGSGLMKPNRHKMRVMPHHLLPTTEVFVAVAGGEVVCTLSLVGDGELALPMESIYDLEVSARRIEGFSVGEVSCLADRQLGRERSFPVVMRLMALMAQSAKYRGIDQLMIAVHPRHARFYQRFCAFKPFGKERAYNSVCNHPAVAMAVDLTRVHIDDPRAHRRFFGKPFTQEALRHRPIASDMRAELEYVVEETYDANCGLDLLSSV